MDINDATRIKNIPCQKVNALSGILGSSLLAFICIKVNRVEAVAVVATHAVIRPTPQMTWPATKSAGAGEDMSKIKPARKVMVAERYPRIGKANLATLLYVWIIRRIMVAAVANKAIQIKPRENTTGPATNLLESTP